MVSEDDTAVYLPVLKDVTYREIHAIEDGFYCGIHGEREHGYTTEKHYWRVGWVLGDFYDRHIR